MTPSHACAQEGELDCLRYLIKVAHAHEHAVDNNGCTLLHYGNISYTNGQPEVLQKISLWINLTLPVLYISESCIEIKVKFLFSHFFVVLQKVWDTTKEYENKI